jgi:hypothetical protein
MILYDVKSKNLIKNYPREKCGRRGNGSLPDIARNDKLSQSHSYRIKKNAHQSEKHRVHTGPDSEMCAQPRAYC